MIVVVDIRFIIGVILLAVIFIAWLVLSLLERRSKKK